MFRCSMRHRMRHPGTVSHTTSGAEAHPSPETARPLNSNLYVSVFSAILFQTLNSSLHPTMTACAPATELQSLIRQLKASTVANQKLLATLQTEFQFDRLPPGLWKQAVEAHQTHMETTIAVIKPLLALAQTQEHQQFIREANDVLSTATGDRDHAKWLIANMLQEQIREQREEERLRNRKVKTPRSIQRKVASKTENRRGEKEGEQIPEEQEEEDEFFDAPESSDASRESATPTPEIPATPTKQKRRIDVDSLVGTVRRKRIKSVPEIMSAKRKRDSVDEPTSKRWKESLAQYERRYLSDEEWRSGTWNEIGAGN